MRVNRVRALARVGKRFSSRPCLVCGVNRLQPVVSDLVIVSGVCVYLRFCVSARAYVYATVCVYVCVCTQCVITTDS